MNWHDFEDNIGSYQTILRGDDLGTRYHVGAGIFISYRREDSAGHVGRLRDRLSQKFNEIFLDIETIRPGQDFRKAIDEVLGTCYAMIVVIGKNWLSLSDPKGHRRLDDPDDLVRYELSIGLKRNIYVIPVLVQNASIPKAEDLPGDLKQLVRRNAFELSDTRFDYDVERLTGALTDALNDAQSVPRPPWLTIAKRFKWALGMVLILVILLPLLWRWNYHGRETPIGSIVYGYIMDDITGRPVADVTFRVETADGIDITQKSLPSDSNGFYIVEASSLVPRTAKLTGIISGCDLSLPLTKAHELKDRLTSSNFHPVFRHVISCGEKSLR